jgi:hypothetical protein
MAARVVLVDTNVIITAHRTSSWKALTSRFAVETVETCVAETQTGAQRRPLKERIDPAALSASLSAAWPVSDLDRAALALRDVTASNLDAGERDLWAHALTREDAWLLSGPDKASLRFGVRLGFGDRLVALEALLDEIGHRPRGALPRNYTRAWHAETVGLLAIEEGARRP